jgi:starch synthase
MDSTETKNSLRIALAAWEIGRTTSGLGVKVGGLGTIVEELPPALVAAGRESDQDVEVVTLSPCFGGFDRSRLEKMSRTYVSTVDRVRHEFELYEHRFDDGQRVVYFWNARWLESLGVGGQIYPPDSYALGTYAAVCQAMAGYLNDEPFDTLHLHDYHVALIPFYLDAPTRGRLPFHLTIHNASYQGAFPTLDGPRLLESLHVDGSLFEPFFRFHDNINLMRAGMVCTHQSGGKVTTVSGDLEGTWGYARELRQPESELIRQAGELHPKLEHLSVDEVRHRIYRPAQGLREFHDIPVLGITNGIADDNKAERLPWLKAEWLRRHDAHFGHPEVQQEMLNEDHHFVASDLTNKQRLKRLVHLEAFGREPTDNTVLFAVVGRMVEQKGLDLVAGILGDVRRRYPEAKFVILGTAPPDDRSGQQTVDAFLRAARRDPDGVFFRNDFDMPLSKLLLAGSDFSFIPSRFEPCGIVDYESALLGTIVIGRQTGGLAKVREFSFLYRWDDMADTAGEREKLLATTFEALMVFSQDPHRLYEMRRAGMEYDASWRQSATQYLRMYQAGRMVRRFLEHIDRQIDRFAKDCDRAETRLLRDFLQAGSGEQRMALLAQLHQRLTQTAQ